MSMNISQEIQKIADKIKTNVEKELNQAFKMFQVVDAECIKSEKEPQSKSYEMKVKTDDDQGQLRLRTTQKDPSSDWITDIEQFLLPRGPFENLLTIFDPSRTGFNSIQNLADCIHKDVEKELNRTFNTFDVMDYHPILTDPKHTSYYMKVKTDDNGHVRVKTIKKTPDSDWETHVEEYDRGQRKLGGQQQQQSLEGKKKESMEGKTGASQSQKQKSSGMEVEEGRTRGSQSQKQQSSGMEVEHPSS